MEEELKEKIRKTFQEDFRLYEEVEGTFDFEGEKKTIRIDFILAPKDHLIKNFNFPIQFFGIETKFFKEVTIPKLSDLYIQCDTYKRSIFKKKTPFAIFHFTNIDYLFDPPTLDSKMHEVLNCTFGRINIGRIKIDENGYELLFHKNNVFFKKKNGKLKNANRNLIKISYGSGNNKLKREY